MFVVEYNGFLGIIHREFSGYKVAVQWLRQIGRKDLIQSISFVVR